MPYLILPWFMNYQCIKAYAEPALFGVPKDTEQYLEAKRLLKFLDYVLAVPKENVPK